MTGAGTPAAAQSLRAVLGTIGKPLASLSLDVDDLWTYLKTRGDPAWRARPSYLRAFVPHVLELLDGLGLKITFFVVGADAAREENVDLLQALTARGHEVANHSYEHEPWLDRYSREQLADDVSRAHDAIVRATGQPPLGFRGPGYSWSPALFEVLADRGYLYDASTLPTYLGPVARAYYFATSRLSREERVERRALFGSVRDGLRPLKPYRWRLPRERTLLEIPVTTFPVVKTPFHFSYLLYLSRFSEPLMFAYLNAALLACRATRTEPSFLLHPLDLLGGDQVSQLAFFPGMDVPGRRKAALLERVLRALKDQFAVVTMRTHARALLARRALAVRLPSEEEVAAAAPVGAAQSR